MSTFNLLLSLINLKAGPGIGKIKGLKMTLALLYDGHKLLFTIILDFF